MKEETFIRSIREEFKRLRWEVRIVKEDNGYVFNRRFRTKRRKLLIFEKWVTLHISYGIFSDWIADINFPKDKAFLIKKIKDKLRGK